MAIIAREKREAARRAAAERAREKASRKKAAVNPLQALWDANGAAIYAANQAFKTKYGKNMSAKVRRKAIKDATRNGHFNARAYAGNLVKAVTPPPPPNPYAGATDRIRAGANEIDDEKKIGYQDAPLPKKPSYVVPDMSWKRGDIKAAEDYQKNKELQEGLRAYYEGRKFGEDGKYQGDVLADYMAGKDWTEKALVEPYLNPGLANGMFPEPEGTLNLRERASRWLVPREENFVRHPPAWLGISYQADTPFSAKDLFADELVSYQPLARNLRESILYQKDTFSIKNTNKVTSNPTGRLNINFSNGRITLKGTESPTSGNRIDYFLQPGSLSFGQTISFPHENIPNARYENTSVTDIDILGPNWASIKVSNATALTTSKAETLPTGERIEYKNSQEVKVKTEVHRSPRLLLAVGVFVFAGIELGIGAVMAETAHAIPVFLGKVGATIGAYFISLSYTIGR